MSQLKKKNRKMIVGDLIQTLAHQGHMFILLNVAPPVSGMSTGACLIP